MAGRQNLVIAQVPAFHGARQIVLHQHVGVLQQRCQDGASFGPRQVEAERALAAVDGTEIGGVAGIVERRAEQPRLVARRRLDLDHVGAVIGQHLGAERAGQHARQVDDPKTGQRTAGEVVSGHERASRFSADFGSSTIPVPSTDNSSSWLRASCSISTR